MASINDLPTNQNIKNMLSGYMGSVQEGMVTLNSPLGELDVDTGKKQVLKYPEQFFEGRDAPNHMIVFFFNQNKSTQFKLNTVNEKLTIVENSESDKGAFLNNLKSLGIDADEYIIKFANSGIAPDSLRATLVNDSIETKDLIPGGIGIGTTKVNENITNSLIKSGNTVTELNQERTNLTVALYMPNDITESVNVNYNNSSMSGMMGVGAVAGRVGKHALGAMLENFKTSSDLFRGITQNDFGIGSILSRGIAGALSGIGGDLGKGIAAGAGMAINPFMEIIYDNMDFRKFRFTFKFAPSSPKESKIARGIIRAFKFNSAPELANDFLNVFFRVPGTFDIKYYTRNSSSGAFKENPYLNKISTCVCTGVSVNYTGNDGNIFVAFENESDPGAPVMIDLSLEFTELELITKQRVLDGF